jgi:hypothetical protein
VASNNDPKKVAALAVLLAVLVVVVVFRLRPALVAGAHGHGGGLEQVGAYKVPSLSWDRAVERDVPTPSTGRNIFTFGAPPTPTPDNRPTATPAPTLPPRPTPTPPGIYVNGKWILPPPPEFPMSYLGWLGPDRLRVAVFRQGDDVLAVPVGDTVKERFILRDVGPKTVTIGFVGYPDNVTTQIPLAR